MNEKTQYIATGAFVIGALLIGIAILLYILDSGIGDSDKFVMVFDGTAKGLNVGAPIALRGVKIGEVTDVDAVLDAKTAEVFVVVEGEIDSAYIRFRGDPNEVTTEDLVERGLRAQLNLLSLLTGLLYIELDFHPDSEVILADVDVPYEQFPTIPTNLELLAKKLQEIDFNKVGERLEHLSDGIGTMLDSEEFKALPSSLNDTLISLRDLSKQLQDQLTRSGPRIDTVLDETIAAIGSTSKDLTVAIESFEQSMGSIDAVTSADSATIYQLNATMRDLSRASRALRQLAETLEQQPEAVIQGKGGDQQ